MAKLRLAPLDIQHAENLGALAYLEWLGASYAEVGR